MISDAVTTRNASIPASANTGFLRKRSTLWKCGCRANRPGPAKRRHVVMPRNANDGSYVYAPPFG
eukprot:4030760-Prymnesium_polylepis.1